MAGSDPSIIGLLEMYLKQAKEKQFCHVSVILTGHPNIAACDYVGEVAAQKLHMKAMDHLRARLAADNESIQMPPRDESLGANYACYNLRSAPLAFDFITWLVNQEMTRVREGAPGPLRVGFWCGADNRLTPLAEQWAKNVFRPALKFLGAIEDEAAIRGRQDEVYVCRTTVAAHNRGERIPYLRTDRPSPHPGCITVTLREAANDRHRNSGVEWLEAAYHLQEKEGERVIVVRDTFRADVPLEGLTTCPEASRDVETRLALYNGAKLNICGATGPGELLKFGDRPYLIFADDDERYDPRWYEAAQGIKLGEQFPWQLPTQRLVWGEPTFENILAAYREHLGAVAA